MALATKTIYKQLKKENRFLHLLHGDIAVELASPEEKRTGD